MIFDWDQNKNLSNFRKHGIWFEEAAEVFASPVLTMIDNRFDYGEVREISIGCIQGFLMVVVVHTNREGVTRIISARKASKKERGNFNAYIPEPLR